MASHYRLAGMDAEAAAAYRRAGDEARALHANGEALAHYTMALDLRHPERAALNEAIGDLQAFAGNYAAALAGYAVAAVAGPANPPALARKRGELQHRLGEWDAAEALFAASLALLPPQGAEGERAHTLAAWSLTARRRGEAARAGDLARRALRSAEAAGDSKALARAHTLLGSLARPGDPQAALPHLTRGLELARAVGDLASEIAALNSLALARADTGDHAGAIALAEEALAICERMGDRHRAAALHNTLSDLLHGAGRRDEARDHLRRAVVAFADVGAGEPEIWRLTEW
jgi:tetratricopeptide (TPR) repeat protein